MLEISDSESRGIVPFLFRKTKTTKVSHRVADLRLCFQLLKIIIWKAQGVPQ